MTTVTRLAEASRAAFTIIKSSMRCSLTGAEPDWIRKTSVPRIDSSYRT